MSRLADQLRGFHAAVTGAAPLDSARDLIVEDAIAGARDRLGVYAHAYTARIAGVLALDYPKLDVVLGGVRALAPAYLRAYPPGDFSLREAGVHLARFLAERGDPAHVVDLARLERARVEVFDGPDATPLAREELAALDPAEFPALRLRLVPASRVVALASNADDLWDAVEQARSLPAPVAAERTVLVWRREVSVIHRTLDADEARALPSLATGASFADVCEALAAPPERAIELLLRWLDAAILVR